MSKGRGAVGRGMTKRGGCEHHSAAVLSAAGLTAPSSALLMAQGAGDRAETETPDLKPGPSRGRIYEMGWLFLSADTFPILLGALL